MIPPFLLSGSGVLHFWAFLLFVAGAISDYFDGKIARKYDLVSNYGKFVDPLTDKMLILLPLVTFAFMGFYSPWWVVLIMFREVLVTFIRIGWMLEKRVVAAEKFGKWKFGFQVATISFAFIHLCCLYFNNSENLSHFVLMIMVALANVLTVLSGIDIIRSNKDLFKGPRFARYVSAMGVGLLPKAPGTWGSLLTLIFIPLISWNFFTYFVCFALLIWVGYWSVQNLGDMNEKDPGFVVLDEACGMLVTFAFVPINFFTLVTGFLLFRLFDIVKPYPCRKLEGFPHWWGILADDLGAGLYAWIGLQAVLFIL